MPPTRRPAPAPASRAPARPVARSSPSRPAARPASSGYHGEEGRRRALEEQERAEARREASKSMTGAPFRFFCPVGEQREIIVVDDAPDFFRHEHNLQGQSGKWDVFTSCIADSANCPVCLSNPGKQPYFAMYLTIIDLTPYTNRDGIEVPWSKKLLVVKPQQQKKIQRLYERHGTLRGMVLSMTRDGDKEASIGNDIEFIEFLDEDQLAEYYNTYEKDGKTIEIVGNEPFDYDAIFPAQTEEMLAALVGGTTNTYDSHNRAIGRGGSPRRQSRGSGDDWQEGGAPSRPASRAAAPARRAPVRGEPAEEEAAEDTYEEEAPARRAAPAPARRAAPASRTRQPEPEPAEEGVEEEYEDPPQRPASRAARPGPSPAGRPASRPAPREAAPQPAMADRRRMLRGG